ncbi:hypothetical protein ABTG40_18880, partial [Acinetobacter baumannii]
MLRAVPCTLRALGALRPSSHLFAFDFSVMHAYAFLKKRQKICLAVAQTLPCPINIDKKNASLKTQIFNS